MKKIETDIELLIKKLVNLNVEVSIGEPWDFGEGKERNPFDAIIEKVSISYKSQDGEIEVAESALLRVEKPFSYRNLKCEFLLVKPRHFGKGFSDFVSGESVSFNFLRISSDQAQADDPFSKEYKNLNTKMYGWIGTLTT